LCRHQQRGLANPTTTCKGRSNGLRQRIQGNQSPLKKKNKEEEKEATSDGTSGSEKGLDEEARKSERVTQRGGKTLARQRQGKKKQEAAQVTQ
jgi:hypothetical protein